MALPFIIAVTCSTSLATTTPPKSLREMLAHNGVAIEADVIDMAYSTVNVENNVIPVTTFQLSVVSVPAGQLVDAQVPTFLLAGGPAADGSWVSVVGTPILAPGDRVLLVGHVDDSNALILSASSTSVFKRGDEAAEAIVLTGVGLSLSEFPCGKPPTLLSAQIAQPDALLDSSMSNGAIAVPAAPALRWDSFMVMIPTCVE